jgi:hypothetical protein
LKLNRKDETPKPKRKRKHKALLLGLGLDNKDGHVRVTTGPNFKLLGGSKDTHEHMTEKAIKFNEELKKRGKRLEDCSKNEVLDIADKIKMAE